MAWADYWEMLDGRIWYTLQQQGVTEKAEYTKERADGDRERLLAIATKFGVTTGQG